MPSSTSSSEGFPTTRPLATLALALGVALPLVLGLEWGFRQAGFRPSLPDSVEGWCAQRHRVEGPAPRTLALLGASRIQVDLVPSILRERLPGWRVANLAYAQATPLATLFDLARNTPFEGVVILSLHPQYLLPSREGDQAHLVAHYRERWDLVDRISHRAAAAVHGNLTVLLQQLRLQRLLPHLLQGRLPPRQYVICHPDRSWEMHFRHYPDLARTRQAYEAAFGAIYRAGERLDPAVWRARCDRLAAAVDPILERGGRVVLLRLPTSHGVAALDRHHFPRERFWDVLARRTRAVALRAEELPGVGELVCPEASHLDHRDARRLTAALVEELDRRGLFNPAGRR